MAQRAQGAKELIVVLPDSKTLHNGSIMSPCCLSPRQAGPANPETDKLLESIKTPDEAARLPFPSRAQLAVAAAWSPNVKNPPLYVDLPVKDGAVQADVLAKWAANAPLTGKPHEVLDAYGIANSFEIYEGTHTSAVADRLQNHVLPFFSSNLEAR